MRVIIALWQRNMKKFIRDKAQLVITLLMPFFFVYIFSAIFKNDAIENPVAYMLSGVIIANCFQTAFSLASSTVDDITTGFMKEVLVSPISRGKIVIGQILSAVVIASIQSIILLIIGIFLGLTINSIQSVLMILFVMIISSIAFAGLGLLLATFAKSSQSFNVITIAIVMPITFLSGAYVPISILPNILQYVAYLNPLTYAVTSFRAYTLDMADASKEELLNAGIAIDFNGFIITPNIAILILIIFCILMYLFATIKFNRTDFSKLNRAKGMSDML